MKLASPTETTASSLQAGKITRKQLAAYCGLSVRTIDELTRSGVLGHFKIGKSIRYDLAEAEAALRQRFHVRAKAAAPAQQQQQPPDPGAARPACAIRPASFTPPAA